MNFVLRVLTSVCQGSLMATLINEIVDIPYFKDKNVGIGGEIGPKEGQYEIIVRFDVNEEADWIYEIAVPIMSKLSTGYAIQTATENEGFAIWSKSGQNLFINENVTWANLEWFELEVK